MQAQELVSSQHLRGVNIQCSCWF